MSTPQVNAAPVAQDDEFDSAFREMRADADIQFSEVELPEQIPPELPDWLEAFFEWLGRVLGPVGEALVGSWPVLKWILLALLIASVLWMLWRLLGPMIMAPRGSGPALVEEWTPDEKEALLLLEDADQLASEGRFDEATHLLLKRSVGQIAQARPELVDPSSTARELAAETDLPEKARLAFGAIANLVEQSLFALRSLSQEDWDAARAAYADFALAPKRLAS